MPRIGSGDGLPRHVTVGACPSGRVRSQVGTPSSACSAGASSTAEQELTMLDPTTVAYLEAYACGVNAYLADHHGSQLSLEYAVLGLQNAGYVVEPWTPADSVAWLKPWRGTCAATWTSRSSACCSRTVLPAGRVADPHPPYPYGSHPVVDHGNVTNGDFGTDAMPPAATDPTRPGRASPAWPHALRLCRSSAMMGIGSQRLAWRAEDEPSRCSCDPHLAIDAVAPAPGCGFTAARSEHARSTWRLLLLRGAGDRHRSQLDAWRGASRTWDRTTSPTST